MGDEEKFSIFARRNERRQLLVPEWELCRDAMAGGRDFVKTKYIPKYPLEYDVEYEERIKRAYYLNYTKPVVRAYTNHIFDRPIQRNLGKVGDLLARVDGGNDITAYMRKVSTQSSVLSVVGTLVDVPPTPKGIRIRSRRARLESGLLPYVRLLTPFDILDWSLDDDGKLIWIMIDDTLVLDDDPKRKRTIQNRVTVWTRNTWTRYGEKDVVLERGTHNLREVPVVLTFHGGDLDGEITAAGGLIRDIASVNRAIMNWCSLLDEIYYKQTFSQLVIPATETQGDKNQKKKAREEILEVSASRAIAYDPELGAAPAYISPSGDNARVIKEAIYDAVGEIYRMATLEKREGAKTAQSGVAKAYDLYETTHEIAAKAQGLESTENEIARLIGVWMDVDAGYEAIYPDSYDIEELETEVARGIDFVNLKASPTLARLQMEKVAMRLFPRQDMVTVRLIGAEVVKSIDDATAAAEADKTALDIMAGTGT